MSNISKTNYWNQSVKYDSKCLAQNFMTTPMRKKRKEYPVANVVCGGGDPGCSSCGPCRVSSCGCS